MHMLDNIPVLPDHLKGINPSVGHMAHIGSVTYTALIQAFKHNLVIFFISENGILSGIGMKYRDDTPLLRPFGYILQAGKLVFLLFLQLMFTDRVSCHMGQHQLRRRKMCQKLNCFIQVPALRFCFFFEKPVLVNCQGGKDNALPVQELF